MTQSNRIAPDDDTANSQSEKPTEEEPTNKTKRYILIACVIFITVTCVALIITLPIVLKDSSTDTDSSNAVLVLGPEDTVPFVVNFKGEMNFPDKFDYGEFGDGAISDGFEGSCSASLFGEHYIFGGGDDEHMVRKIVGCELKGIGELSFPFNLGACITLYDPKPIILLCFDFDVFKRSCYTFDGEIFQAAGSSKYSHDMTALANYRGKALATGCNSYFEQPELAKLNCGIKTELMDMYSLEWSEAPDFPWGKAIFGYTSASTDSAAFIFGGTNMQDDQFCGTKNDCYLPGGSTRVAQFKDNRWSTVGNLHRGRTNHGSITIDGITMILGGWPIPSSWPEPRVNTEVWTLDDLGNSVIEPSLSGDARAYIYNPPMFAVDFEFCKT